LLLLLLTNNDGCDECDSPNGDSSSTQSRQSPAKLLHCATRGKLVLAVERSDSPGSDPLGKTASGKIKGKDPLGCMPYEMGFQNCDITAH
jgi:hypothetical protein